MLTDDSDFSYVSTPAVSPLPALPAATTLPDAAPLTVVMPSGRPSAFLRELPADAPSGGAAARAAMPGLLPTVESEGSLQLRMDLSFESSLRSPLHEGTSLSPVRRGDGGAPGFILGARAARAQPARRTRMSAALDDESDEEAGCADDAKLPAAADHGEGWERANAAQAGEAGEEQVMAQRSPEVAAPGSPGDVPALAPVAAQAGNRPAPETAESASEAGEAAAGLEWEDVGATPPSGGRELFNPKLAFALKHTTSFAQEDMDVFGVTDLRSTDFILAGDSYFRPTAVEAKKRTVPAPVCVDDLDSHAASPKTDSAQQRAPMSGRPCSSHGRRAIARLGFWPLEEAKPFVGSSRPKTPKHRPHSRVWLESYFSKLPLWFPQSFDVAELSARGIHLDKDGERELNLMGATRRLYLDPMPGHLRPGGLFADGPGSPMKLRLGKTTDWGQDQPEKHDAGHGSALQRQADSVEAGEHRGPPLAPALLQSPGDAPPRTNAVCDTTVVICVFGLIPFALARVHAQHQGSRPFLSCSSAQQAVVFLSAHHPT